MMRSAETLPEHVASSFMQIQTSEHIDSQRCMLMAGAGMLASGVVVSVLMLPARKGTDAEKQALVPREEGSTSN